MLAAFFMASIACLAQDGTQDKPKFFPKLFGLNKSFSVGIIGGTVNHFDYGAIGITSSIYGFHVDLMGWPRKHKNDSRVGQWEDHSVFSFHVGYQVPFHQYKDGSIRLIPLLGYAMIKRGITDGYDYEVGGSGIENAFRVSHTDGNFDYGAALAFQRKDDKIGSYNFYIAYTRYTAWVGLGIEFPFR